MKKQNRNAFAYIRQPNVQHNEEPLLSGKGNKQSPNQTMFNQIAGEMDHNLKNYISKLVTKNQKEQEKKKLSQKSSNHERTKSYADILVQTPSSSKTPAEKGHSHRGSHPSTQINNIFFSLGSSPVKQKPIEPISQKKITERNISSPFLETLDTYINDLSLNTASSMKKMEVAGSQDTIQRKSVQKTRENSASNLRIIQKLETSMKRQKQLKIANQILASENEKLKLKLRKNKNIVKTTLQQLYHYAQEISKELKYQKRQKRRLEEFISEFQSKFNMLRPQRKTSGARPRLQQYLLSQTTEQDDVEIQQISSQLSKSIKKRKAMPRSTAKNSRVSGFHIEELSAMLASKNYEYDDEDQSQNYET